MNVATYKVGGETFLVYASADDGPKVYEPVGRTDVPRALASHQGAALVDGNVVWVEYEDGLFQAYHDWMGKTSMPTWTPRDVLKHPATLLKRVWAADTPRPQRLADGGFTSLVEPGKEGGR